MYVTVRLLVPTVHDADPDVTNLVPSPFVLTIAVKLPPTAPFAGRLLMTGVVGAPQTFDSPPTVLWPPTVLHEPTVESAPGTGLKAPPAMGIRTQTTRAVSAAAPSAFERFFTSPRPSWLQCQRRSHPTVRRR